MANPPYDQWGNPLPNNAGPKRINKSDGTSLPIRSNLKLSSDLTATDSPDTDETIIDVAGAPGNANLAAIGGLTSAADTVPYFTGSGTAALTTFTAAARTWLAAAAAAAQTAILDVATASLKGLLSAAGFTKLAGLPDQIHNAVFTAVTSVTTATWSANTYRRIQIIVRVNSGTAGDIQVGPVGLSAGSQYLTLAINSSVGVWTQDNVNAANTFSIEMIALPQTTWIDMNVAPATAGRNMHGVSAHNDGSQARFTGISVDTTNAITGLIVTFAGGACTGHLEVLGWT